MSFQKYPYPKIEGDTISNLILVDKDEYNEKKDIWNTDKNTYGFSEPNNSKNVYLNINLVKTPKESIITIQHEIMHNLLELTINSSSSTKLDNLFYHTKTRKRLKKNLFGMIELSKKEAKEFKKIKMKGKKNKNKHKVSEVDFWLFSGRVRI